MVLAVVSRHGAGDSVLSALVCLVRTLAAILPHLAVEAFAYVLGAMAAVFLSKALEKYPVRTPVFRKVLGAVVRVSALAVVALAAAAALEAWVAPWLVRWLV